MSRYENRSLRRKNGASLRAGTIETAQGSGESFVYDAEWLSDPNAKPLSMTLPLQTAEGPAIIAKQAKRLRSASTS